MSVKTVKGNTLRNHAGMYSLHEYSNGNGNRPTNFAFSKIMFVGSTEFNQEIISKIIWKSPGGKTENLIHHLVINKGSYQI
jgi:hypothetical protein